MEGTLLELHVRVTLDISACILHFTSLKIYMQPLFHRVEILPMNTCRQEQADTDAEHFPIHQARDQAPE